MGALAMVCPIRAVRTTTGQPRCNPARRSTIRSTPTSFWHYVVAYACSLGVVLRAQSWHQETAQIPPVPPARSPPPLSRARARAFSRCHFLPLRYPSFYNDTIEPYNEMQGAISAYTTAMVAPSDGVGYGNFDFILGHFPRLFKLYTTLHAPRAVIYLGPMLIVCCLVLAMRCHDPITSPGTRTPR